MISTGNSYTASSWADQQLRVAFVKGETLNLSRSAADRKLAAAHDGAAHGRQVIHAPLIRELLLSDPVPGRIHQVSVRGADIEGELDLRFAKTECALRLERCTFHHPVRLSEAHLQSVCLRRSVIPELDAGHVTVTGDLVLDKVKAAGQIRLAGAHLGDDLHLAHARIGTKRRPADSAGAGDARLDLQGCEVKGKVDADHLIVYGLVNTAAATVQGSVRMTNVRIRAAAKRTSGTAQDTIAWDGNGMKAGAVNASGLRADGMVRLIDAQVLGLVMSPARIKNAGRGLVLDRLTSHGSVFIDHGSRLRGGIHAIGMQVGASLYLDNCTLRAPVSGSVDDRRHALDLRRAKIGDDLHCETNFRANGACDLRDCRIIGRVSLAGASLQPAEAAAGKTAFIADGAQIGGELRGDAGFTAWGILSLINTQIQGGVIIEQAERPGHQDRISLAGAGLSVTRDVRLDVAGTVDLSGAQVNGDLILGLGRLESPQDQAAADLSDVKAGVLTISGRPKAGFLDLTRACVTRLHDHPEDWPEDGRIVLDGLEYSAVAAKKAANQEPDRRAWLKTGTQWVRSAAGDYRNPGFTPQPYQHLAAVYRQAGEDRKARAVLLAMHRRHNKTMVGFRSQLVIRVWNIMQDIFVGYGYAPMRALCWLIVLALGTAWWFASHGVRTGFIQPVILSLGLVLPGSGLDKVEAVGTINGTTNHTIAAALVLFGLLFGASVIAALGRVIKR